MKDEILTHLNDPRHLERIYRNNKLRFKQVFSGLYPELKGNTLAEFWNERLTYEIEEINWGTRHELFFVIIIALIAGLFAKLPALLPVNQELFFQRNFGFVIFPFLTTYFAWKNKLPGGKIAVIAGLTLGAGIYINLLPARLQSDTLILACIHLGLFLWSVLGFAYVGGAGNRDEKRLGFLQYNGDLLVMTALITIAGGIMSGITVGLFSLIGFDIKNFYFENIVVYGMPAAPILGTYLIQTNPQLVGKVAPVIARIFSPLVLVMLLIYLVAIIYSGKDPYNDREFLLIFNALLVGVMAIIFFSIAESSKKEKTRVETWILFLLSALTIIVNAIALSAILFRISEYGITPNRAAVLGGNVLILVNLVLVTVQLFKVVSKKSALTGVGKVISFYLPAYVIWAVVVVFLFPVLFGFK